MFIKIQYTEDKRYNSTLRLLTAIVNDPLITDVATLQSRSSTWNSHVIGGVDFDNSQIIRTEDPTNVKMKYSKDNTTWDQNHDWIAEFDVYDNPGQKWYVQSANNTTNTSTANFSVGTDISGSPEMSIAGISPTIGDNVSNVSVGSTILKPTNTIDNNFSTTVNPPIQTTIRTMWAYVTNDCLVLSYTLGSSTNNGMPNTFGTLTNSSTNAGPYFFGHYERWDYWNKPSNGIVPVLYSNIWRGNGQGLIDADWYTTTNTKLTVQNGPIGVFRVFGTIDALPAVKTSWPVEKFINVNCGVGLRNTASPHLYQLTNGSSATATALSIGPVLSTIANYRFISEDLKATSFAMLPITWGHSYYQNMGGSFTARTNVYIFNGEYFPGDEYTFNNKTYMIWPFYNGFTNRLGIAIPKE
jgi:hypothetical protein